MKSVTPCSLCHPNAITVIITLDPHAFDFVSCFCTLHALLDEDLPPAKRISEYRNRTIFAYVYKSLGTLSISNRLLKATGGFG